ncbi:MAG: ADP-heptosyltransferase [Gemmatimonadota bacterium]|nr:MAG: ADP-heptosyltransferase [Gemmatimonadota bacterium]
MSAPGASFVFTQYCPDSIGEQAVQIPFFRLLRSAHPDDEIVGIAPERSAGTLDALGLIDRLVVYPVNAGWGTLFGIARELRRLPCRRAFLHRRKSLRTALLARMSTSAPVTGFVHPGQRLLQARSIPFDLKAYIGESYTRLLGKTVADFADATPRQAEGYVLIIPGGRTAIKRYPMPKYRTIAQTLGLDRPVQFLLGPDMTEERAFLEEADDGFQVHFAPPIAEGAEIVRRAALVIANDCGPGHFAHVHDVPRISLFDASIDPAHWFFPGRNGRLLQSKATGELAGISADEILGLAQELLHRNVA